MATLGGFGFWWLVDIIRTGSGPVYAGNFRVAADLPHWVFLLSTIFLFVFGGFIYAVYSYMRYRIQKREAYMSLRDSEEFRHYQKTQDAYAEPEKQDISGLTFRTTRGAQGFEEPRKFGGYGSTLPGPLPSADAPYAQMPIKGVPTQLPPVRLPPVSAGPPMHSAQSAPAPAPAQGSPFAL